MKKPNKKEASKRKSDLEKLTQEFLKNPEATTRNWKKIFSKFDLEQDITFGLQVLYSLLINVVSEIQ